MKAFTAQQLRDYSVIVYTRITRDTLNVLAGIKVFAIRILAKYRHFYVAKGFWDQLLLKLF